MGLDQLESKFDSNPVFAARSIYEISEYALVESITRAFIAHAQSMHSGFYCFAEIGGIPGIFLESAN